MMSPRYGASPVLIGQFDNIDLREVMYYLYLPVKMGNSDIRLPPNVECCLPLIYAADAWALRHGAYEYVYLSARKGWATPDNPLNRPGWHADGFGTDDLNAVWWRGPGTRFAEHDFGEISKDHVESLRQFEERIDYRHVGSRNVGGLYGIDPYVVHATPNIDVPGCMRQYVKISFSNHQYNLENNSHNYLFDYDWPLHPREEVRNDTSSAGRDYL